MGMGFVTRLEGMVGRNRSGKQFLGLDGTDRLACVRLLPSEHGMVGLLSLKGRLLVVGLDEIKVLATGGRGVALLELDGADDRLVDLAWVGDDGLLVRGEGRGGKETQAGLKPADLKAYAGRRARKGKPLDVRFKPKSLGTLEKPQ
jgi:topoisomerase-4 subunit A